LENDANNFNSNTAAAEGTRWTARIIRVELGPMFGASGAVSVHSPDRFRYIAITLEVVYHGPGAGELYPQTVTLVHVGATPLQGLARPPAFFQDGSAKLAGADQAAQPVDASVVIAAQAGVPQRITLAYEFHRECHEFCLYFPGCEGMRFALT
jgi:hypothetical protein